ncbi:spore coat protein [Mycoplasmatota bacterium zrk1]
MKTKINTIKNPDTKVEVTIFNDKDILNNILCYEKDNSSLYSKGLNSASSQHLFETLFELFNETQNMHRALYNLMFKKGWNSIAIEDKENLKDSYNLYKSYINELKQ